MMQLCLVLLVLLLPSSFELDNGVVLTPPMGWMSWQRFRCNLDCKNDPDNCISEKLYMVMAKHMAEDGYRKVGYEYVMIDDCWMAKTRDSKGRLQADPVRFPSGIKKLADYTHNLGLKLGIYADFGTHTCMGYPGSMYYMQLDAQTFADWGIDFLKFDACNAEVHTYDKEYPPMQVFLNMTGRQIGYSYAFPKLQRQVGVKTNYQRVRDSCNLARNYEDIADSWDSMLDILAYYAKDEGNFSQYAGPGYFNSPDQLIVGNYGLSYEEEKSHIALWAILAAPFYMSVDFRNIRAESKALLQNTYVIAIDQDALGIQGTIKSSIGNIELWTKPVLPKGSMAFVILNKGADGTPKKVSMKVSEIGIQNAAGYQITEVFDNKVMGIYKPDSQFSVYVNPSGVFFGKASPAS